MWFSCKTSFDTVPNRAKLMIKVMAFIALVLYLTLVLCQNVNGYQDLKLSDSFRLDGRVANTVDVKHDFRIKTNIKPKDELKIRSATATPKPPTIELNDIFISVKTTKNNHNNRLDLILNTWQQLAKEQEKEADVKKAKREENGEEDVDDEEEEVEGEEEEEEEEVPGDEEEDEEDDGDDGGDGEEDDDDA